MKTLIVILKIIFSLLLLLDLFFWAIAHGTSHIIPAKTDWAFALTALLLVGLLTTLFFIGRKRKGN